MADGSDDASSSGLSELGIQSYEAMGLAGGKKKRLGGSGGAKTRTVPRRERRAGKGDWRAAQVGAADDPFGEMDLGGDLLGGEGSARRGGARAPPARARGWRSADPATDPLAAGLRTKVHSPLPR